MRCLQQLGEVPSRTRSAVGLDVAVVHLTADLLAIAAAIASGEESSKSMRRPAP